MKHESFQIIHLFNITPLLGYCCVWCFRNTSVGECQSFMEAHASQGSTNMWLMEAKTSGIQHIKVVQTKQISTSFPFWLVLLMQHNFDHIPNKVLITFLARKVVFEWQNTMRTSHKHAEHVAPSVVFKGPNLSLFTLLVVVIVYHSAINIYRVIIQYVLNFGPI